MYSDSDVMHSDVMHSESEIHDDGAGSQKVMTTFYYLPNELRTTNYTKLRTTQADYIRFYALLCSTFMQYSLLKNDVLKNDVFTNFSR